MRHILRALAAIAALALSATAAAQQLVPIKLAGGERARINIVFVSDGFQAGELGIFATEAQSVADSLLNEEPFKTYKDLINIYRLDIPSVESGVTTISGGVTTTRNTALNSTLGCFNVDRLLCADNNRVFNAISASGLPIQRVGIPLLIANSLTYGGGGGTVASVTRHPTARLIAIHELAHQFAFLADEYVDAAICAAGTYGVPGGRANASVSTDRAGVPWSIWIDAATPVPTTTTQDAVPGVYAGAYYCDRYSRPTNNSIMRTLGRRFEQVNSEALIKRIHSVAAGSLDAVSPAWTSATVNPSQVLRFVALPKRLNGVALPIVWRVNGAVTPGSGAGGRELVVAASSLATGSNTISVSASDPTTLVRSDPQGVLAASRSWTVNVALDQPRTDALAVATLPSGRSVMTGETATAYATVINTTANALANCRLALGATSHPMTFSFVQTNPATNAVIGTPNTSFTLGAGASASFVFSLLSATDIPAQVAPVTATCDGVGPSQTNGANQFVFSAQTVRPPDIISIAVTPAVPGGIEMAQGAQTFFAVAAVNIGAAGDLTVRPVTTDEKLPAALTVCENNPATGVCLTPPAPALKLNFASQQVRTFTVFATSSSPINFDPANFRASLEMRDFNAAGALGALRGSTGVSIRTTF